MRRWLPLILALPLLQPAARAQTPPKAGAPSTATPAAPAPATPAPAPSPAPAPANDPNVEAAKLHFQQGVALFNDGNYNAALAEFGEAYRLRKSPGVLYNIGLTQKALFRYSEAIESLTQYLGESGNIAPERKQEVEQLVNEMRALLADVTLTIEPPGASIAVDGRTLGTAPLAKPLGLAAGSHTIEITADGYKPQKRDVLITAGVPLALKLTLERVPRSGKVHIRSSVPLATVIVDGKTLGPAPLDVELGAGGHALEVSAPKYDVFRSELVVAAGQSRDLDVTLTKMESHLYKKWYLWTPIAVGAAALAVGLGVGLGSQQKPLEGTLMPGVQSVN